MYDCSKQLEKFYRKKVVLSAKEQNELREKRKLNIKRLKDGLSEYNSEKNKNYKIAEERIQGSMAMHTITQNDKHVTFLFKWQNKLLLNGKYFLKKLLLLLIKQRIVEVLFI